MTRDFMVWRHDCHVLLQRILPVVIRPFVANHLVDTICDLSRFFQMLCARELKKSDVEQMKKDIISILCKLEAIFPPAFFTIIVHICIHLPEQVFLTGPVHHTWMFPIESQRGMCTTIDIDNYIYIYIYIYIYKVSHFSGYLENIRNM